MAQFKCKMCGGNIEVLENQTVATCEFCGTEQTITRIDNDKKIMLFNRANSARLTCDFDKALRNYETILIEFPNDAEAHWGICLCRYGIEYVNDPRTNKKIPTCHRTLYTSIFDDTDYKEAIKNADVVAREIYKAEAEKIDKIQKNIIAISQREEPFDVFICYKETDEKGKRTIDSVIAQDIYEKLIEKGYKVFFARITLETKIGLQYEPIIFAALQSSKIMLAIGSKTEYFNAVWVKNEWSRFLSFMQDDKEKYLIPCFKDMEAYDMPEEFLSFQAQSIDKLGFMQDLIRGIDKILGRNIKTKLEEKTTVVHSDVNIDALLTRVEMLLDDEDWNKADELLEKILNNDPKNSKAYFYKLMIELESGTIDALLKCGKQISKYSEYKKAYDFADTTFRKTLQGYNDTILKNIEEAKLNEIYKRAISYYNAKNYNLAYNEFKLILNYKDASILAEKCLEIENEKKYSQALMLAEKKSFKEAIAILRLISQYKDSQAKIKEYEETLEIERKNSIYVKAIKLTEKTEFDISAHRSAVQLLSTILDYKDSKELVEKYTNLIDEHIKKEEKEKILRADRRKLLIKISLVLLAILTVFLILTFTVFIPNAKYDEALSYLEQNDYDKAYSIFVDLESYKESENKILLIKASKSFDSGNYKDGVDYILNTGGRVTVVYDTDGGNSISSEELKSSKITATAKKDGYTFYGWILTEYTLNDVRNNNNVQIKLKASYNPIEYKITYNLDGGTSVNTLTNEYLIINEVKIPNLTKDGYTFLGWYTKDNSTPKKDYKINKGTFGDIELFAKFEANTYKITYNTSGGSLTSTTQSVVYNSKFNLSTPTKTGYTFKGWYYNDVKVENGTWKYTSNITLVAKWEETSYKITYSLDGGVNNSSNIDKYTISTNFTFKIPTKTGYTFAGWKVGGKTHSSYSIATGTTGDITLVATWSANSYTATFDPNGGSVVESTKQFTYDTVVNLPTPTKTGYTFAGWYYYDDIAKEYKKFDNENLWKFTSSAEFTASWTTGGKYEYVINYYYEDLSTDEMVLYNSISKYALLNASVTGELITINGYVTPQTITITMNQFGNFINYYYYKDQFSLTFVSNGGNAIQNKQYLFGSNVRNSLPTPIRTGYTFGGWYENADLTIEYDGYVDGNITLYAWWKEESKASQFSYTLNSSSVTIKSFVGTDKSIVVPEYISGKKVTTISANCFLNKTAIISVEIPSTVSSIGSNIFAGCSSLNSISIPFLGSSYSSGTNIGYLFSTNEFTNSYLAEGYYIPSSLNNVEVLSGKIISRSMANCTSLTQIIFGNNVNEIQEFALYGCSSLKTLYIPFVGVTNSVTDGYTAVFGIIFGYTSQDKSLPSNYEIQWSTYPTILDWDGEVYGSVSGTIGQISWLRHIEGLNYADRTSYFYYIPQSLTKVYITNETTYYKYAFNGCDNIRFIY